jgi:Type II secretion system (T2SS), protein E, N-terminal domain
MLQTSFHGTHESPHTLRLGQILTEQGVLRQDQVDHIVSVQRRVGRPFGDLAERLFGIDPKVIEDAWVRQYTQIMGPIDPATLAVDQECIALINRRQAWQFFIAPVHRSGEELLLITTAKNLVRASNFAAHVFPEATFFRISGEESMQRFLMKHYPVPNYLAEMAQKMH